MPSSIGYQHAESHAWDVEDSLCYDKAHGEEEVGGGEEGDHHQTQAEQHSSPVGLPPNHAIVSHGDEASQCGQGQQVPGVSEGGDGRNGVHGILSTQLGGAEQQPNVEEAQVAPVQLTVRSLKP